MDVPGLEERGRCRQADEGTTGVVYIISTLRPHPHPNPLPEGEGAKPNAAPRIGLKRRFC